ncbi:DUF2931 family protein [Chryseobacterium sp. 5_R23647]|uniref:DUF2931 family protein n=1 Tax=Chryseobacterium sp. 5_R23647 TaxID=2258964 RepID=UPI000E225C2B|nr:DUF2931 family protein [Chryseobacterium sp. 5_R23647]REC43076.1 hypothetical protein DRF69_09860 [Chryseobacterium sp. 5_R23647]
MDKSLIKIIIYFLFITQNLSCQDMKQKKLPEFQVEICSPTNDYLIEFVSDKIFTLEGNGASLPYGGTSGEWGYSGSGWTEQHGTPIGADITYYAGYEDTFYRLKVDFPLDKIKDYMERAYAQSGGTTEDKASLEEYKRLGRNERFSANYNSYNSFSNLVFGFAPKGMVVVWLRYGMGVRIELGRYQAEVIKEDKELEKKLFANWSMNRQEVRARDFNPEASPQEWDNYRIRYAYKPVITGENKALRLFEMNYHYYNAELEIMLRPWINNIPIKKRAIPKEISFVWETGKDQQFVGRAYFSWEKTNEAFKKAGNSAKLEFKIAPDNNSFEIFLNDQPLKADSTRVFKTESEYKDSYNDYN